MIAVVPRVIGHFLFDNAYFRSNVGESDDFGTLFFENSAPPLRRHCTFVYEIHRFSVRKLFGKTAEKTDNVKRIPLVDCSCTKQGKPKTQKPKAGYASKSSKQD